MLIRGGCQDYSYGTVTIPATSKLIFDDTDVTFKAHHITVHGSLEIGGEDCPIYSNVVVELQGSRASHAVTGSVSSFRFGQPCSHRP